MKDCLIWKSDALKAINSYHRDGSFPDLGDESIMLDSLSDNLATEIDNLKPVSLDDLLNEYFENRKFIEDAFEAHDNLDLDVLRVRGIPYY